MVESLFTLVSNHCFLLKKGVFVLKAEDFGQKR